MSLPNYLAKIKSAGLYRFTFDKSQIPSVAAETMRLVVGYSEKGPFNNPVYIDNKQDFINLFGNINKRLEKKGIFFHRLALQALSGGPILALNLKPFTESDSEAENKTAECVNYVSFNSCENPCADDKFETSTIKVVDLFDRDRFWKIDSEKLAKKITKHGNEGDGGNKYINIAATDVKELSCSFFVRKCHPTSVKSYDISIREWYKSVGEEMPEYLEGHEDDNLQDYFAEIYVFRGKFTEALIDENGVLSRYFKDGALTNEYTNNFGEAADALTALAADDNSNCLGVYRGCLLPYFKDQNGNYVSLDILFNSDKDSHKMIMKLDESKIEDILENSHTDGEIHNELTHWGGIDNIGIGWKYEEDAITNVNTNLKPIYVEGYTYGTILKSTPAEDIYTKSISVLNDKGIFEALTNHVDSEFHYIVDTYATPINVKTASAKSTISYLAKTKDNCLAIMNAPSMAEWQSGVEEAGLGKFSMENLENGKYKSLSPLPSEVNGASFCAFYTPLIFGEGIVRHTIPSAAIVSNLFLDKWYSRQPYYIVAGPNYGLLDYEGMIGPDYNYSRGDLDVLEPMGINAIVYVPRKGTFINSNQTAKQTPVSALSKVHVRELVIYIQNEIEQMLQSYQWELNTQALRDKIKAAADSILERIKNNGGVYAYLNVCDGTNNTPEVIDNEMVILDTSIEPARGAGKMVQRLTIHKTGGLSSLIK